MTHDEQRVTLARWIVVVPLWIVFLAVLSPDVRWVIRYRQLKALDSWLCAGLHDRAFGASAARAPAPRWRA